MSFVSAQYYVLFDPVISSDAIMVEILFFSAYFWYPRRFWDVNEGFQNYFDVIQPLNLKCHFEMTRKCYESFS